MTYHVLVKVRYLESGFEEWYTYFDVCAENESEAVLKGKERFLKASVPDEVEAIEFRALEAKPGERFSLCEQSEVFELEDYEKNALGKIVRALERMARKEFSVRSELTPIVQNSGITPFLIFSSVCLLLTIIVLIVSKLLFQ